MLKDSKILIYGGGLFAGAAVCATVLHSEGEVCIDHRLMCAPPPIQMGDLPSEDGPQAPVQGVVLTIAASVTLSVSSGALYVPVYAPRQTT